MPSTGTHNHMHTPRVRNGEPQPAAIQTQTPEPASAKRDLTSWWRQFSKKPAKKDEEKGTASPSVVSGIGVRASACSVLSAPGVPDKAEGLANSASKPHHHLSHAFTDQIGCTQRLHFQAYSAYPLSRAYHTRTLRYRCSTSTEKATSTATCQSWSQNAACT
jgi:hypothetical protein